MDKETTTKDIKEAYLTRDCIIGEGNIVGRTGDKVTPQSVGKENFEKLAAGGCLSVTKVDRDRPVKLSAGYKLDKSGKPVKE